MQTGQGRNPGVLQKGKKQNKFVEKVIQKCSPRSRFHLPLRAKQKFAGAQRSAKILSRNFTNIIMPYFWAKNSPNLYAICHKKHQFFRAEKLAKNAVR